MNRFEDKFVEKYFNQMDIAVTSWMAKYGLTLLRIAMGIVFLWFGMLKFFPGYSPAEELVKNTVFFINPDIFIIVLAAWETLIGIGLITGFSMRLTLILLFLQMPGTALPIFVLPEAVWTHFPFGLTLEGQYIFKNLVLVAAAIVLGGNIRKPQADTL